MNDLDAALEALKEKHPEYFRQPDTQSAGTGWPTPTTDQGDLRNLSDVADRVLDSSVISTHSHDH